MKILIIEDELAAARRLQDLVSEVAQETEIIGVIDSVESAVKWLRNFGSPDLILMDIQLADGLSFEIFAQVELTCPVVFTTAYDEFMLQAFKVHSVDYLLKPVDVGELSQAFEKYRRYFNTRKTPPGQAVNMEELLRTLNGAHQFRKRFLVKRGQQLVHIPVSDIGYFYSEEGMSFFITNAGKRFPVDHTIDELEQLLDPADFFRINRGMIVCARNIGTIHPYFNQRLKLDLTPDPGSEVLVSRDRVRDFKSWLGG